MTDYLAGALTLSFLIAALFFLKFWKKTGDRLFVYFAIAFVLFAVNQVATSILENDMERAGYAYILRVLGYLMILFAIVGKNRATPGK